MGPRNRQTQERVSVPLDRRTREIAKLAAVEAVRQHMETCPMVREFRTMHTDIYGLPGEKTGEHPGVIGDVADLKKSRGRLRIAMQCAWGLLMVVLGAILTR